MAVIKDVAKLAGVSTSTVSKYLNNPDSLRESTRLSVEDAIHKLNYTPNLFARHLRVQSSRTIAVIAQEISNPFHATIYNTIRREALKQGYTVVLYSINDVDGSLDDLFQSMPIHYFSGFILCYFHDMDISFDFARSNSGLPIVIMTNDRSYEAAEEGVQSVYIDFTSGIATAAEHLVGLGKTDIAYVGCMTRKPEQEPKFLGFTRVVEKYGLKPHSVTRLQKEYTTRTGYESAEVVLAMERRPDAILVDNDIMAMGVLRCLADQRIRVPEDIMVTGFDDISLASVYCPALTTVHVPIEEVSVESFRLLLEQIERKPAANPRKSFSTKLVVRETTGQGVPKPKEA